MGTMRKQTIGLALCVALFAMNAVAQTVTGSGTSGAVPVFSGASTVTNSPITVSGTNIISNGGVFVGGNPSVGINNSCSNLYLGSGAGTIYTVGNQFLIYNSAGTAIEDLITPSGNSFLNGGNLGVGTTNPSSKLTVTNGTESG
ncbi:MAG: hypothetical protein WBQ94_10525, partial [Terracidiphilus sp.]